MIGVSVRTRPFASRTTFDAISRVTGEPSAPVVTTFVVRVAAKGLPVTCAISREVQGRVWFTVEETGGRARRESGEISSTAAAAKERTFIEGLKVETGGNSSVQCSPDLCK